MFLLLALACLELSGCATMDHSTASIKTGMHIDAVLEFAIEYPLTWGKDRRLSFGSKNGEVRWTPPGQEDTLLKIKSQVPERGMTDAEHSPDPLAQELVGQDILLNEKITLPAGDAAHIIGNKAGRSIESYYLSRNKRSYLISLSTSAENDERYADIMQKVVYSFQILPQ